MLADTLRTDRARLRPLVPDAAETVALRRACRTRKDLVGHRVAAANQLRAHLKTVLPGAADLFSEIDSVTSLAFLTRFDTQDRIDWLTPTRLARWLASVGYSGRTDPAKLHAHLSDAPRGLTGPQATVEAGSTHALIAVLTTLVREIKKLQAQISDQLDAHADAHIFTSLPRSGCVRAARLLAEIGDSRARFPTPDSLACLAGVAPSTRQSGKMRAVGFRWACDKQLRDAVTDFAGDNRHANPWAANLCNRARTLRCGGLDGQGPDRENVSEGRVVNGKYRKFTPEYREEAVKQVVETSTPIAEVARSLGTNAGTLGNWVSVQERTSSERGAVAARTRATARA